MNVLCIQYDHSILRMSIEYSYDIWCCLGYKGIDTERKEF